MRFCDTGTLFSTTVSVQGHPQVSFGLTLATLGSFWVLRGAQRLPFDVLWVTLAPLGRLWLPMGPPLGSLWGRFGVTLSLLSGASGQPGPPGSAGGCQRCSKTRVFAWFRLRHLRRTRKNTCNQTHLQETCKNKCFYVFSDFRVFSRPRSRRAETYVFLCVFE